jgi:hypothetical protein
MVIFTRCDLYGHPSRALVRFKLPHAPATIVMCTHRSRKGKICGREYMVLDDGRHMEPLLKK